MDIDHSLLRQLEKDVEPVTSAEAGRRLVELSNNYDFTLFEYFLSDLAGHSADHAEARRVVQTLDCLLARGGKIKSGRDFAHCNQRSWQPGRFKP